MVFLEKSSKEIIEDIHKMNELFFDQIKFPDLWNDEDEPEYTTEDLIWKNPTFKKNI
ncbi:hypothetical protein LPTSP4_09000 [Leptospira ryugenii]|uniref:Uncharacterized protein n=2 Tax=Leptospira ryugenii TaxID=1917863 RepID=A0A2P2DXN4_9LEPT|nr:hypothetical protein LPTSP4_09000 [Leptospira ryugenii]